MSLLFLAVVASLHLPGVKLVPLGQDPPHIENLTPGLQGPARMVQAPPVSPQVLQGGQQLPISNPVRDGPALISNPGLAGMAQAPSFQQVPLAPTLAGGALERQAQEQARLPPMIGENAAQASKVVEALDEDKIASEIEALQQKLGELQANIDKVLREEAGSIRNKRAADGNPPDIKELENKIEEVILTVGALEAYIREKIVSEGGEVVGKEDKGQDEEFIGDALKGVPGNSDDDENRSVINDGNEDLLTEAHEEDEDDDADTGDQTTEGEANTEDGDEQAATLDKPIRVFAKESQKGVIDADDAVHEA